MTPFRQIIHPNDSGLDVLAVKRTLKRAGFPDSARLKLNLRAGAAFVHCVKVLQAKHHLNVDGIYGPATHALVAPKFRAYEVWLYRKAKIRSQGGPYINPFHLAKITLSRTDMGVDFHGTGPIVALGEAEIVGNGGNGWPGSHYLLYRLRRGEHAGRYVYVAEAIEPFVRAGQHVDRGQAIARFGYDAAPGRYPGIETGWSTSTLNLTLAHSIYYEGYRTPQGKAFARFLRSLGCPTLEDPGPGPHYV